MTVLIYVDTSVYNRPFDDQTQPRIWLETLAFSVILQMIENNLASLIHSAVVDYENSRNPDQMRRAWVRKVTAQATDYQRVDTDIRQRASILEKGGLKPLDALHVACGEAARADYFITCDDRLITRYQGLPQQTRNLTVCNPTEFVRMTGG